LDRNHWWRCWPLSSDGFSLENDYRARSAVS
jgi:hypothetical protein